ncbi:UDP-N-acetylglucosamine 2-epimerase (non-hydrolyzing) [Candidatus Pelagibacter sp.]|nr:UDP-N-acetylglucosamine 2-epimerase (non-hydrolyzing) [Candidatus Pelagibacter sp.]
MKKILLIFGTRPEAIKMISIIKELKKNKKFFNFKICVTGQHKKMLKQVLDFFEIKPHFNINVMQKDQSLESLTSKILKRTSKIIKRTKPDLVLVHGDTTSTLATSLACYYNKTKVAHVEAGLRTGNIYSPWPEEINRKLTAQISEINFSPTLISKKNLISEGIDKKKIFITGNTVIDALLLAKDKIIKSQSIKKNLKKKFSFLDDKKKLILVTGHRRENFGNDFNNIFKAIKYIALNNQDINIIYPTHLNPKVLLPAKKILGKISNVFLVEPLDYISFIYLMNKSYLIISDSGGVQEEAPSLGVPVLVTRKNTERPEALNVGTAKLVGTNPNIIIRNVNELLENKKIYRKMTKSHNPYGNGYAAKKIIHYLKKIKF